MSFHSMVSRVRSQSFKTVHIRSKSSTLLSNMSEIHCAGTSDHSAPEVDTWGTKGHLTVDQQIALMEFVSQANEKHLNIVKFTVETLESVSLRFLRARQFDVTKAMTLLAEAVTKKEEAKALHFASVSGDECVKCDLEGLKKFYPHDFLGYDKFSRPILYELSGQVNPSAVTSMTTFASLIDYHWHVMEKELDSMFTVAAARNPGTPPVISTCAVLDLEGLGLVHCSGSTLDHVKAMVALDNTCYPETLGKMLVINAPWLAGMSVLQ
jgi:hypothetical protein